VNGWEKSLGQSVPPPRDPLVSFVVAQNESLLRHAQTLDQHAEVINRVAGAVSQQAERVADQSASSMALFVALLEVLRAKGVLDDEDVQTLFKKVYPRTLAGLDQLSALARDDANKKRAP
jgi:erythromycin esterase-like protein